jgi:hypothetical protein
MRRRGSGTQNDKRDAAPDGADGKRWISGCILVVETKGFQKSYGAGKYQS